MNHDIVAETRKTTMRRAMLGLTLIIALGVSPAWADTCVIDGTSRVCDILCGSGTCSVPSFAYCDTTVGNNDGWCTMCGTGTIANTIVGTSSNDWICGKTGDDTISGGLGDDWISGGDGHDTLNGNEDDDTIFGDGGNDTIEGHGGANFLVGGTAIDTITNTPDATVPNLGSVLCGGAGADVLNGGGWGHTCMDAGTNQPTTGTDCTYSPPAGASYHDVATQLNCKNPSGTYHPRSRECGCP